MFLTVQFPITDARPFTPGETFKLNQPVWSSPEMQQDFVRSFGVMQKRKRGGVLEWLNEDKFCSAENAVKFDDSFPEPLKINGSHLFKTCIFRRFLADGRFPNDNVANRLEVGIRLKWKRSDLIEQDKFDQTPHIKLNSTAISFLIASVANQRVRIKNTSQNLKLIESGKDISRLYFEATTKHSKNKDFDSDSWWIHSGRPLVILEYEIDKDLSELPEYTKTINTDKLPGIELNYLEIDSGEVICGVWLLGIDPGQYTSERDVNYRTARQLRVNLLRFHTELESIKRIFRLVALEKIKVGSKGKAVENLQKYLNNSIKLLSKESRYGLPQTPILEIVQDSQDLIALNEREMLTTQLSDIRQNILRKIEEFINKFQKNITYKIMNLENLTMTDQSINIENSTVGDVNQIAAKSIENSFNKIAKSEASDELKAKLAELNKQVTEMLEHLPEAKQEEVAKDLKVLTDEATSANPRKKWYELSADGLIEAAQTVGKMSPAIIATVKAVLTILG